jgi:aspartyl/asparaginyl beta-hydroxylase (cupin superfamily)
MLAPYQIAAQSVVDIASSLIKVPVAGARGKEGVQAALNRVFSRCEELGVIPRLPAIDEAYPDYPELRVLEQRYPVIRDECLALLDQRERITDITRLAGGYTADGIHAIRWKAFMLKSGELIPENAKLCPKTAELVGNLPGVYTAFFSILEPKQYITPHCGYFKGFVRYHLGVVIPNDNNDRSSWLRINADPEDNASGDRSRVERAPKHYWKNGRGFIFDDTNLHDASNDSDQVRVVLWVDVLRKLPRPLSLYAKACIALISREPSIRKVRKNAIVHLEGGALPRPNVPT